MTTADRVYAAEQLLAFLERVGPVEAVWAMTTTLEALQDDPTGDHLGAAVRAFEQAEKDMAAAGSPADGVVATDKQMEADPKAKARLK